MVTIDIQFGQLAGALRVLDDVLVALRGVVEAMEVEAEPAVMGEVHKVTRRVRCGEAGPELGR